MGGILSDEGPGTAQEQLQQLRAQQLLMSQLQERAEQAAQGPDARAPLGMRPTERPGLRQAKVVKNPVHLQSKSINLAYEPEEGGFEPHWELRFLFDASSPCEVVVHTGLAQETLDVVPLTGAAWASEPRPYAAPRLGLEYRGRVELGAFCPEAAKPGELSTSSLCVELRTSGPSPLEEEAAQWTLVRLSHRAADPAASSAFEGDAAAALATAAPAVVCEARGQRVRLPGSSLAASYELHEVFGAELRGPAVLGGADCVICMSEPRDTAVLPCRHMCLCGSCADAMRSRVQYRSYRCPICRERVSCLEQIHRSDAAVEGP